MRSRAYISSAFAAGAILALNVWAATGINSLSPASNPESVGFDGARLNRLDSTMAKIVVDGRAAGMTTFLARHGKIVEFKTYGKMDLASGTPVKKDTIFALASMTKPVTGVAMMILFEEGKWRLDDPVTRFIPEFKSLKVVKAMNSDGTMQLEDAKRPPTMREIMSHSAGFGYGTTETDPVDKLFRERGVLFGGSGTVPVSSNFQEMVERMATIPLKYQPGTNWAYSSVVDIQAYIIEKISGQKFSDFLAERIFKPLKMTDTAFYLTPDKIDRLATLYAFDEKEKKLVDVRSGSMRLVTFDYSQPPKLESGGGGLVGTTMDYARFSQMLLNKGELDGVRILAPATVELMGKNVLGKGIHITANGTTGAQNDDAIGFGLDFEIKMDAKAAGTLQGDGTIRWAGAFGTWFWVDYVNDVIFVGMIQRVGGLGGYDDLNILASTLTYQALTHPEK